MIDRRRTALNQSAPLFIPEEERSAARFVVDVRNPQRAADVAAGHVQLEFRPRLARLLQEVIVGVVGRVAVEVIDFAVVVVSSGLEHHQNGSAGTNSVIRAVVAVQGLEFGDRVLRRQVHEAAAATAVILLAAVDHVDVVRRACSVEADAVRGSQRIDAAKWRQVV